MTKRLICLILCVLMLLMTLVACSDDGDAAEGTAEEASRYTTTLNVWMITESELMAKMSKLVITGLDPNKEQEKLTEEEKATIAALSEEEYTAWTQLWRINSEINKITKNDFKTKINLKLFTEEEYYVELEKAIAKQAEDKANGVNNSTANNTNEETFLNDYGIPELKYPTVPDHQVDVMFLGGFERYDMFVRNGWLAALDTSIEEKAALLGDYVNSAFLLGGQRINDVTYVIPNNRGIGDYLYLAVNEQLMSDYGYTPKDFNNSSVFDATCKQFLDYVYANDELSVTPIYSATGEIDQSFIHYWSYRYHEASGAYILKPQDFSIFGTIYSSSNVRGEELGYSNILTNTTYLNQLQTKIYYESRENYITTDPEAEVAVKIVRGGLEEKAALEAQGYSVLVTEVPRATDDVVYGSMFAVSSYSTEVSRATEIIAKINTDPKMRNLLQYGVEEVNYTLGTVEENGVSYQYVVPTADNLYEMDIEKTGNMFIAYAPCREDIKRWENEKVANGDAKTYPTLGFFFETTPGAGFKLDTNSISAVQAVSDKFGVYLDGISTPEEFAAMRSAIIQNAGNSTAFATYLLSVVGEVSCRWEQTDASGNVTVSEVVVDVEKLAASIDVLKVSAEPESTTAVYSAGSLYLFWRSLLKG